jgi:RND family efflux transporter MFP subunit
MTRALLSSLLLLALAGCDHDHPHPHEDAPAQAEPEPHAITDWTADTELFVEFDPLVVGNPTKFAAHFTWLDGFAPASEGQAVVTLRGGGAPEERFSAPVGVIAGIYGPTVTAAHAAQREVLLALETDKGRWEHPLGTFQVFASADDVPTVEGAEEDEGISFLKEQQWKMTFSTALVGSRALHTSLPAFATLEPQAGGQVEIAAPAAGRLLRAGDDWPVVGQHFDTDTLLARFVPKLEGAADLTSLNLAVSAARLDVEHAQTEYDRLEGLLAEGAVAQRRVDEARHVRAEAREALAAAKRRLGQHRRVQRARGGGSAPMDVRTPIAGTVVDVLGVAGSLVDEGEHLFDVVDLRHLWLRVRVPEADAHAVADLGGVWFQHGDTAVELGADALVSRAAMVDPVRRTVDVVFALDNPQEALRVGQRLRVQLQVGTATEGLAVPADAVVQDGGLPYVFVQTGGESFERRQVQLGVRDRDHVQVTTGVTEGERVVVAGAYAVKLASASTTPPAHGHAH